MSDVDSIVKKWSDLYSEEVLEFARPAEVSNEEVFAEVYHSLIHSPAISNTLVQLEHLHARTLEDKIDKNVQILSKSNVNDAQNREYLESRLASDLSNIRDTQYREFREWVMRVHEEFQRGDESNGNSELARSQSSFSIEASPSAPRLQESFTITLGAQMKQMHNLRLVAADVLDLCRYPAIPKDDSSSSLPQRLQTSMSLYSNNICGVVLLDNKDLDALLNRSNEYHFANYEQQLESIMSSDVKGKSLAWRKERIMRKKMSEFPDPEIELDDPCLELKSGDFYVTRHSNLCEVHVLFHMITDESILSGSINSRHPAVMGLRNVLKTASLSDVTTVTIPLLLASEMHEIMTVAWCMKRAELVFKCVKGFMMEVASWGGSDIKTLQFLVPKDIDEDVFNRLTSMLAGIFRTSNPIRGM
ncbi:FERRY endosomal RAB5 effector complex subunit 3 [Lepeophtheirus salmonis]|uniref:FERRY endosomal RAB5 effector complex subunit 3 n=1 Tax=Lepeophtheirus salmonis TaxID=72036 RepID=UPI001AE1E317|nr:protein C12orf4 homolog [Lepeophtheirus salmonis]